MRKKLKSEHRTCSLVIFINGFGRFKNKIQKTPDSQWKSSRIHYCSVPSKQAARKGQLLLKKSIVAVWFLRFIIFCKCHAVFCCTSTRGDDDTSDSSVKASRVQEQREKMQAELQVLWTEQCDQLKKKKEQCATEVSDIKLEEIISFKDSLQSSFKIF